MQFESLYHSVFTLTSLKYGMNVYEAVEAALRRHVRQAESWESFMRHASAVRQRQDRARKLAHARARARSHEDLPVARQFEARSAFCNGFKRRGKTKGAGVART